MWNMHVFARVHLLQEEKYFFFTFMCNYLLLKKHYVSIDYVWIQTRQPLEASNFNISTFVFICAVQQEDCEQESKSLS